MKVFIENLKGHMAIYEHIKRIKICKKDNKWCLQLEYIFKPIREYIPLKDVRLCYATDMEKFVECFRYEK